MLYDYDLTPVEVDINELSEVEQEIVGWTSYDADDISSIFEYDAEERIEEHIRDLDELQEADEEEIDMIVEEALEVDVPEVALELARYFVDALISSLESTKDSIEESITILENIY
mgnify:CR=1 FL=1